MPKRKAVMKNIIYELDNYDIEISSEDEVSVAKITRLEPQSKEKNKESLFQSEPNGVEVLSVDSTDDSICLIDASSPTVNGGKSNCETVLVDSPDLTIENKSQDETESDGVFGTHLDDNKIILTEDAEDSSPDICVAGCENRTPLVTVQFKRCKLSNIYRYKIKQFIIKLLKKQGIKPENVDNNFDEELDIWPEDLAEVCTKKESKEVKDNSAADTLFFVDTIPGDNLVEEIPKYGQIVSVLSEEAETDSSCKKPSRSQVCYNCNGLHALRDCKLPKSVTKIAENRSLSKTTRYHVDDEQKFGNFIPGRLSGRLRDALGLKRNAIPLHVYRMRVLGYPPGWLEDAKISHSGIAMFDSTGSAVLDPQDEDGELSEAGGRDKYDIKKILDFPGFNVPASSRYSEEAHLYGLPPMSEEDSKIRMLQTLAPNAMKAYKRKKLTFFPSAANISFTEGQVEMELDSGDEETVFPLVPPLPDEAPPPLPPPPEQPPPPPSPPADLSTADVTPASPPSTDIALINKTPDPNTADTMAQDKDVEMTSLEQVSDIPIPEDCLIVLDEYYEDEKPDSGRSSPSLDDLEMKKQTLIQALEGETSTVETSDVSASNDANIVANESSITEEVNDTDNNMDDKENISKDNNMDDKENTSTDNNKDDKENTSTDNIQDDTIDESCTDNIEIPVEDASLSVNTIDDGENEEQIATTPQYVSTPEPKSGYVKGTSLGAPILNIASSYVKLPSDDKFSKHICDVINFENLPDSTGKYKKISNLLKKVKTEVERIQES